MYGVMNMRQAKGKLIVALIVTTIMFCGIFSWISYLEKDYGSTGTSDGESREDLANLEKFSSYEDITKFLESNQGLAGNYWSYRNLDIYSLYNRDVEDSNAGPKMAIADGDSDGYSADTSSDHSTTNVQEEGVDEGDIVKNDGEYAYVVSKDQKKVVIVDVYPAEDSKIVSEIEVDGSIIEIYLVGDKLVVLGRKGNYYGYYYDYGRSSYSPSTQETFIEVYDVENRKNPVLSRSDSINGSYVSSRMIGDHFYLIGRQSTWEIENEMELAVAPSDIHYVDGYDHSYSYTNIVSINIQTTLMKPTIQTILMGSSSEIYVSLNNIYLTYSKRLSWVERKEMEVEQVIKPMLPEQRTILMEYTKNSNLTRSEKLSQVDRIMGEYIENLTDTERNDFYEEWRVEEDEFTEEIAPDLEKTVIYRISIRKGEIAFRASGEVPGYILNRFSMGEYNGYFRIATTTGHVSRTGVGTAKNHLYVLDMQLQITGNITDIAPGERIYSARFMGDRAYLVTFDKVDPFFVIDLQNPYDPYILGELKIPGYSDYLHPYDENHVIGLGKETVLAEGGSFSWYQGVKLSLFEVTDVNNPKEISKYIIGDRGTYSPTQNDPHAFLFSLSKNLLVIPIKLYEIDGSEYSSGASPSTHGDFVWEGAYVFHVSSEEGFTLKGRISHSEDDFENRWNWYNDYSIKRSFYIDDVLYTVSNSMIKANDLDFLNEIKSVEFSQGKEYDEDDDDDW